MNLAAADPPSYLHTKYLVYVQFLQLITDNEETVAID